VSCWRRCALSAFARPPIRPILSGLIVTDAKVVDASALAALIFAEPDAENIAKRVEGARLAAPSLLDFELANVCLNKMRRQPTKRDAIRTAFRLAHRLKVETVAVDHEAVVDLAETTGLTAYDASYLWQARTLDAELVTLDRKLAAASI
jgi:predicted nucleic acid-binding protein